MPDSVNGGPLTLLGTSIRSNVATEQGGGIFNIEGTTVTLGGTSSVTRNTPDDCVGTPAC
jgi:hypothetical protein